MSNCDALKLLFKTEYNQCKSFVQTRLSVASTMVDVVMTVSILLVVLCAHVTLDMSWILMEQHVMVS